MTGLLATGERAQALLDNQILPLVSVCVKRMDKERCDDAIGRVILKSVSGDYLTRKGDATEFNRGRSESGQKAG